MAWTAPMTFIPNTVLTAAQLNTHLRDNLLEQGPAKAVGDHATGYMAVEGPHKMGRRIITSHRNVSGYTSSGSWTDLSGANSHGPTIRVKHGEQALIMIEARIKKNSGASWKATGFCGVQIFGATNRDPDDRYALKSSQYSDGENASMFVYLAEDLTPGTSRFRMKYKVSEEETTAYFSYARILIMPF